MHDVIPGLHGLMKLVLSSILFEYWINLFYYRWLMQVNTEHYTSILSIKTEAIGPLEYHLKKNAQNKIKHSKWMADCQRVLISTPSQKSLNSST